MNWETKSLSNIITFQRGFDLPKSKFEHGIYPVVGSTGIIGYHNKPKVTAPGVVTGRSGSLGVFQYLDVNFWPHNTSLWVKDFKGNHPKFIYYFLHQFDFKKLNAGAAVPTLNRNTLSSINVTYTKSLQTQKHIAEILSAYDDLIENNLKRIKLLEQAAQNIYKEWFVNMRFPGHENTPINSETGLPEGWSEKSICEFDSFKQYKVKIKPFEGNREYLATANISGIKIDERGEYFSYENKPSRAQIQPPVDSVWFARMSKTDKVLFLTENSNNNFMISSGFAGFKAEKKEHLPFLFCLINDTLFSDLKDSYATGSTQISINNNSLKSINLIEPQIDVIEKFGSKTYDSLKLINHLFRTNEQLKKARDILLPRLMNQTIKV